MEMASRSPGYRHCANCIGAFSFHRGTLSLSCLRRQLKAFYPHTAYIIYTSLEQCLCKGRVSVRLSVGLSVCPVATAEEQRRHDRRAAAARRPAANTRAVPRSLPSCRGWTQTALHQRDERRQ